MTPEETKIVVHATVLETLTTLGIDMHQPLEMQEDMAWLRQARLGSADVRKWAARTLVGTILTGLSYLIWQALVSK